MPGADPAVPDGASETATIRFGIRLAGIPLLMPAGEMLEYLPEADVYPLPLAPRGLRGLMQLRGHPVAVFEAGAADVPADTRARLPVLLVGEPARAAALVVDEAPSRVVLAGAGDAFASRAAAGALDHEAAGRAGGAAFAAALAEPVRDAEGRWWWPVDCDQLFETLSDDSGGMPGDSRRDRAGAPKEAAS